MLELEYASPGRSRTWPAIVIGVEGLLVIGWVAWWIFWLDNPLDIDYLSRPVEWCLQFIVVKGLALCLAGLWTGVLLWWVRGFWASPTPLEDKPSAAASLSFDQE